MRRQNILKKIRTRAKLNQGAMAKEFGFTYPGYYNMESKTVNPRIGSLAGIFKYLESHPEIRVTQADVIDFYVRPFMKK